MGFNCGIVGLPNVGKSTIFNALTSAGAEAANYPFCTIEPNKGIVAVPDPRLQVLSEIAKSVKVVPTTIEFVDIAGLVRGASKGEGLGNQFLGHIRAVDAIVHVVRCFADDNVTHVEGSVSPTRDVEVIETELLLADLSTIEARIDKVARAAKTGDKEKKIEWEALELARKHLAEGQVLREVPNTEGKFDSLGLLTTKPVVFVANVSEKEVASEPQKADVATFLGELYQLSQKKRSPLVVFCGMIEAEIATLPVEERALFLSELGLETSGLDRLALAGYNLLELITFFTVGPKETHAWTCQTGSTARTAAGKIHSDFERGFIRAEVIGYEDFVTSCGESGAREKGLLRIEGKEYLVRDGDIMHFRFNV